MNESRIIFRHCACCGKGIEVQLTAKDHWWQERKILSGGYYFFGGSLNLRQMRSRWSWSTRFLGLKKSKSKIHQFFSDHIWWWSVPEQECRVPNWKKPYYMLRMWIEDTLDPPEKVEYWECTKCFDKSMEEDE